VEKVWFDRIYSEHLDALPQLSMEIPLQVAYMPDQDDFQESNQSFEKSGQFYRIIKQRYKKDTLEIVFVPDVEKNQLKTLVTQWVERFFSKHSDESQHLNALKAPFQKYQPARLELPDYTQRPSCQQVCPMTVPDGRPGISPTPSSPPPERA